MKNSEPRRTIWTALWTAALLSACEGLVPTGPPDPLGAGGSSVGDGGSDTEGGAAGARSGAGGDAGDGGDAGQTGGGDAGHASGAGGEGGGGDPVLGARCRSEGALACAGIASPATLICKRGEWREGLPCANNPLHLCDRSTGVCALACEDECDGTIARVCGPDRVRPIPEQCLFGCSARSCRGPAPNQLVVHRPSTTQTHHAFWPDPVMPVCLGAPSDWSARQELLASIRDTVESTWGRHAGVSFPGWGECGDGPVIRLEVLEGCEGELVRVSREGYPGPAGSVDLGFCATYHDSDPATAGDPRPLESDLTVLVALHAFAHALGFSDEIGSTSFMHPAIDLPAGVYTNFYPYQVQLLQDAYGRKPLGSLLGSNGRCLTFDDSGARGRACDGSPTQLLEAVGGSIRARSSGLCLSASADSPAELVPCDPGDASQSWEPRRVRWIAYGNQCVSVSTNPASPLSLQTCAPDWTDLDTWGFEFLDGEVLRIRHASNNCVLAIDDTNVPGLGSCTDPRALFQVARGEIESKGRCLTGTFNVLLERCDARAEQRFHVSGRFDGADGRALAWPAGAEVPTSARAVSPPPANQVFDYHF